MLLIPEALHEIGDDIASALAQQQYGKPMAELTPIQAASVRDQVAVTLKTNRYDADHDHDTLSLSAPEADAYRQQTDRWKSYSVANPDARPLARMFLYASLAIPVFYLPALFFGAKTNFTVVDTWRFWIIHLWVEGFFEFFATTVVALTFFQLGLTRRNTALRVIYLDAILYFGGGLIGTGHHWYFNGQSQFNMAMSAMFSVLEVVPLTLLTLDAWDFVRTTRGDCDICDRPIAVPHKWTFYFLIAVGFWNFLSAGVIHPSRFLGHQHRPADDGSVEPVSRRRAAGVGCGATRLLACAR